MQVIFLNRMKSKILTNFHFIFNESNSTSWNQIVDRQTESTESSSHRDLSRTAVQICPPIYALC